MNPLNMLIFFFLCDIYYNMSQKTALTGNNTLFTLFRAEFRHLQFGRAELPKATGNRHQSILSTLKKSCQLSALPHEKCYRKEGMPQIENVTQIKHRL